MTRVDDLGDAEVEDLQRPDQGGAVVIFADDEVHRFHVAMDDAPLMCVVETVAELFDQEQPFGIAQRNLVFDDLGERLALDELHDDEGLGLVVPAVEDDRDVGMIQLAGGRRFLAEPLPPVFVDGELGIEQFERDVALHLRIPGPIDDTEPSAADQPQFGVPVCKRVRRSHST